MEIINTYEETLAHYNRKLSHAEEELEDALKGLQELEILASEGWQGKASEAFRDRIQELSRQMAAPRQEFEEIRRSLSQLGAAIEEEIRLLMEAEAAKAAAALNAGGAGLA